MSGALQARRGAIAASRRHSTGPADPASVPGTLNRWRADAVAQANGSAVASWAALVGGVPFAQATGANQGTYQTNSINGKPGVRFVTDDWMAATIAGDAQPVSYMVVLKPNSVATYQTIVHNGVEIQLQVGAGTTWEMWGGSANLRGGTPTTSPVVLTIVADTTDTLYVNGANVVTGDGGSSGATTTFTLGRHPTAGRPLNADVCEVILGDHAWTAAERTTLHSYVQDYYGITVSDYDSGTSASDNHFGMMIMSNKDIPTQFNQDLTALIETGSKWMRFGIPEGDAGSFGGPGSTTFTPNVSNMDYFTSCCQNAKAAGIGVVLVMADTIHDTTLTEAQYRTAQSGYWGHVSQRLGQYVDLWQVFNEHDGVDYRNNTAITMDAAYLDRMRLALDAARTALAQYSTAPLTTTPFGYPIDAARLTRWQAFFDGVQSSLGVIGIHGYPETSTATMDLMASHINNLKARYGKPVAILEFGLPKITGYGTPPLWTEIGAGIVNQINRLMPTNPMVATLYQLRDRGTNPDDPIGEWVFGVIENNFTKKTYWQTVSDAVHAL